MTDEISGEKDRRATYREVFAVREFDAVFAASTLSWLGDNLARAAIAFLVFQQSGRSIMWAAVAFAIGYLPWIAGGPILAALAERYPYRRVMIICDLSRAGLVATMVLFHQSVNVLLVLLFVSALLAPPFQAARSALLPQLLDGDRYVVGLSIQNVAGQIAQVSGYLIGGVVAAVNPRLALGFDALTFITSALLLTLFIRPRPPALAATQRTHLLRETAAGFRIVFGSRVLRSIAFLVFLTVIFAIVPEGLAVGWADSLAGGAAIQGLIMAANPVGVVIGSLVIGRLTPTLRQRLIRPVAVLGALSLVPALAHPPLPVVLVLVMISGVALGGLIPPANGLFVQALPNVFRARAFGVMQAGVQLLQGAAVLGAGALSHAFGDVPAVVGWWSAAGVVLLGLVSLGWPSQERIDAAIDEASLANTTPRGATPRARLAG